MMAPQDGECFPGTRFTIVDLSDENAWGSSGLRIGHP